MSEKPKKMKGSNYLSNTFEDGYNDAVLEYEAWESTQPTLVPLDKDKLIVKMKKYVNPIHHVETAFTSADWDLVVEFINNYKFGQTNLVPISKEEATEVILNAVHTQRKEESAEECCRRASEELTKRFGQPISNPVEKEELHNICPKCNKEKYIPSDEKVCYECYKNPPVVNVEDWPEEFDKEFQNPYPESVFIPLTLEDNEKINKLLKDNGFSRDQISGDMGRHTFNWVTRDSKKFILSITKRKIDREELEDFYNKNKHQCDITMKEGAYLPVSLQNEMWKIITHLNKRGE